MSAITIDNYSSEIFKVIPEFVDAVSIFAARQAADAVDAVGRIFVEHNMYEQYGLIMVHRHFPVSTNEILVETINESGNLSVTMPWTIKGLLMVTKITSYQG